MAYKKHLSFTFKKCSAQRIANKKPIYIGIGQLDSNHPYSIAAIQRFRELRGNTQSINFYFRLGSPGFVAIQPCSPDGKGF